MEMDIGSPLEKRCRRVALGWAADDSAGPEYFSFGREHIILYNPGYNNIMRGKTLRCLQRKREREKRPELLYSSLGCG
jgi:hypothetical protein